MELKNRLNSEGGSAIGVTHDIAKVANVAGVNGHHGAAVVDHQRVVVPAGDLGIAAVGIGGGRGVNVPAMRGGCW
eukprot:scaffold94736_cov37-Prasinocladus_malaysianus.AAC.1